MRLAARDVRRADDHAEVAAQVEAIEGERDVGRGRRGGHGQLDALGLSTRDERVKTSDGLAVRRVDLAVDRFLLVVEQRDFLVAQVLAQLRADDLLALAPGGGAEEFVRIDAFAAPLEEGDPRARVGCITRRRPA